MIVCSCTLITSEDIAEAVAELRTEDPLVVLTRPHLSPARQEASCGNCLPLVTKLMVAYDEEGPGSPVSAVHPVEQGRLACGRRTGHDPAEGLRGGCNEGQ